jgi:hypothetical protein
MRAVWTLGFVAAAALSFCFPDFIVFRFTQGWWAIGARPVLLCGVSDQPASSPGRAVRRRLPAILANQTHVALGRWSARGGLLGPWRTTGPTGVDQLRARHRLPLLLRWR